MFESVLNQILNQVLGDYIENLDPKQLNLGIWGGDLVLRDLVIKQSALEELGLPIQAVFGRIQKLVLKIPWKNLYGAPLEASVEGVYILVRANNQVEYDAKKEEKQAYDVKKAELKKIDEAKRREKEIKKSDSSYATRITMHFIKNLRVSIKNIHIRYEDSITANPYAMGISLASLQMQTMNDEWQPAVLEETATKIFKVVSLEALALYWNCRPNLYCSKNNEELLQLFLRDIATEKTVPKNYSYILGPISAVSRVKVNMKPENDVPQFSVPQARAELVVDRLNIGITKCQYKDLIQFAEAMAIQSNGLPYRKYRPKVPSYKGYYKQWWKFAYTSILETQIRRRKEDWNWHHMLNHRELCKSYGEVYKALLTTKKLPKEQQEYLQSMEMKLDLLNIVLVRQRIELEVERMDKKRENKQGWFKSWWNYRIADDQEISDSANILKKFENAMTDEEKEKLYKAIDYTEHVVPPNYPPNYTDIVIKFHLKAFEINVKNDVTNINSVVKSKLKDVKINIERRPVKQAIKLAVFVENISVLGMPQDDFVPEIVASKTDDETGLLNVLFETNPLNSHCGQRLHVKAKPLRIVFDSITVNEVIDIFTIPPESSLEQLSQVTSNKINDFKEMSATGLQHVIDKHVSIDLDIDLSAPYVIIPHSGIYTGLENVLVIYLGKLSIKSTERKMDVAKVKEMHKEGIQREQVISVLKAQTYDKFIFEMTNIQIMISQSDEDYLKYIFDVVEVSPMHLLTPLSIHLTFETCLITDDPKLPLTKISGEMPLISINVTDARLLLLISLVNSITAKLGTSSSENENLVRTISTNSVNRMMDLVDQRPKQGVKVAEPSKNMVQLTTMKLNFVLKELKLTVSRQEMISAPIHELLQFNIKSISCILLQQTYQMDINLYLESISFQQHVKHVLADIITSNVKDSDCLFHVKYIKVDKKSPEFYTVHESCQSALLLNFASLNIKLIQEALLDLLKFSNDIQGQLSDLNNDPPLHTRISTISSRKASASVNSLKSTPISSFTDKPKFTKKITNEILFKLLAELKHVSINFESDCLPLSSFTISDITTEVVMKQAYTKVSAILGDISIIDMNAATLHKTIFQVQPNEKALSTEIIMYNNDLVSASCDMAIKANLGRIKICFVNWYISNMLMFLNKFQAAQQVIVDASNKAAQSAKENMHSLYDKATKIKLDINLNAPEIIVPESSKSSCGLLIDLGHIMITNKFNELTIKNEAGHHAIIDELVLKLEELKFERVKIGSELKLSHNMTLLEPLTFTLLVYRNLSSWYKALPSIDVDGNIHNVELQLGQPDYETIMRIITVNLSEGSMPKPEAVVIPSPTPTTRQSQQTYVFTERIKFEDGGITADDPQGQVSILFRWNLVMNCFKISLYTATYDTEQDNTLDCIEYTRVGLAVFSLEGLSVRGRMLTNNSLSNALLLVNCLLIDSRPGREDKINCFLSRREEDERTPTDSKVVPIKNMIDVTFQQNRGDTFVDVRVYSFTFILSVEYLLKISNFFAPTKHDGVVATVSVKSVDFKHLEKAKSTSTNMLSLTLKVEKPYFILVEHLNSIDTRALILNCEVLTKVRLSGEHQNINGTVKDIQMYTCMFDPSKREATKNSLLEPFTINIAGSTPENKGLHVEVLITDVCISVSLYAIELITNVLNTLSSKGVEKIDSDEPLPDYSDTWDLKQNAEKNFWFLKHSQVADDALSFDFTIVTPAKKMNELCIMNIPVIIVTLEAGSSNKTFPMLLFESHFEGRISDWSSQLAVDATLSLQMGYYNSLLALWEPLIEPATILDASGLKYKPWELKLEVNMNDNSEENLQSPENEPNELALQPTMSVDISSSTNLELTITKTCLEVLTNLGKLFASAMSSENIERIEEEAPFKVINSSGMDIDIILNSSDFTVIGPGNPDELKLEQGAEVQLDLYFKIVNTKSIKQVLSASEKPVKERYLKIYVPETDTTLELPVTRSDKRYFKLNKNSWGLVSSVRMDNGVTTITICSILQIYNNFNTPIDLYYMRDTGNELELISTIESGTSIYVPIKAVYSQTSELFFSVANYSVTSIPYVWKDLQLNVAVSKNLVCCSKKDSQDLFVIRAVGEMSQVYYEKTSKHTMSSTVYTIHLKPAVILKNCLPISTVVCIRDVKNETTIEPGCHWEFPNIEPGKSYMVIRLSYLEKEWSCRREVQQNPQQFSVWAFDSYAGAAKMSLDLGMHILQTNGSFVMSLYCPFWMINKTGLILSYRKSKKTEKNEASGSPMKSSDENLNILHHPPFFKGPILFSFNARNFFGKKKASVRIENGEWSDKFSIDVAGSSGVVICKNNNKIHQIGVSNRLTYNGLSKQITFTPYYVIINHSPLVMQCQEVDRPADPWINVEPKSCTALWPFSEQDDKLFKVKVEGTDEITVPFLITESHNTLLKLKNKFGGIFVDIQLSEGAIYINLSLYDIGMAPAIIINHTNYTMNIWEKESVQIKKLPANQNMLYTWDNPSAERVVVWEAGYTKEIENDLRMDGVGDYNIKENEVVYWTSFLDGMQRVLLFTTDAQVIHSVQASKQFEVVDMEVTVSIYGMGLSLVNNLKRLEVMYIGIASTGIIWETCKQHSKRFKQMSTNNNESMEKAYQNYLLNLDGANPEDLNFSSVDNHTDVNFDLMVMLKPHKRKLRRKFQTGLWLQMKTSAHQLQIHAKVNRLQIDNQLFDCIFPVLLAPVPPPKSVAVNDAHKPFAELSIVQLLITNSQIRQFKYFKILIQEFHVKVDIRFINVLMEILDTSEYTEAEEKEHFLIDCAMVEEALYTHVSTHSLQEQKSFYDLLHFSPLKIHVSFSMSSSQGMGNIPVFLSVLLQGIGVTLTDLQDVVFKLAYFQREYTFLTQRQLIAEATSHYFGQTVKQLYVLVLGLDVLGNPYGLVVGISKGVEDLFYEPFQGAIQGPGEFAEGIMLGISSLFGHTVGGAAGAVSRITGAMGKGIAALTFDKEYQRKRRDQFSKKPATVQEGLARGGKGLVMGVVDGFTGVFTKPISGAKEQGVGGFFKGLGKGAVGLVTRPTAGVMDFASTSFETVKRVTDFGNEYVARLRAPRFVQADCHVKPYNANLAQGNKLLCELEKGKYHTTDIYSCHFTVIDKKEVLLFSNKRLAYIVHNDLFGGWQVEWSYTWVELEKEPKVVAKGVQIFTDAKKKGLFNASDNGKIILIHDVNLCYLIVSKIVEHMNAK